MTFRDVARGWGAPLAAPVARLFASGAWIDASSAGATWSQIHAKMVASSADGGVRYDVNLFAFSPAKTPRFDVYFYCATLVGRGEFVAAHLYLGDDPARAVAAFYAAAWLFEHSAAPPPRPALVPRGARAAARMGAGADQQAATDWLEGAGGQLMALRTTERTRNGVHWLVALDPPPDAATPPAGLPFTLPGHVMHTLPLPSGRLVFLCGRLSGMTPAAIAQRLGVARVAPHNYRYFWKSDRAGGLLLHPAFFDAPPAILDAIAARMRRQGGMAAIQQYFYDWAQRRRTKNAAAHAGRAQGVARGKAHDLAAIERGVLKHFPGLKFVPISWGRGGGNRRGMTLGHYQPGQHRIVINGALDDRAVPRFVVAATVYHELIHADGMRGHGPKFQARWRRFKDFARAMAWRKDYFRRRAARLPAAPPRRAPRRWDGETRPGD